MHKEIKANTKEETVIVFAYDSFRGYLKDYYQLRKSSKHGFSFRQFSMECGFKSPNIMKLIMDGKRNITDQTFQQIAQGLKLKNTAKTYFKLLVKFNQAKTDTEKTTYWEKLKKLSENQAIPYKQIKDYEYLEYWYYPVIRELMASKNFSKDPHWIYNKLNGTVSIGDITRSLQLLTTNPQTNNHQPLKSSDEIASLTIRKYHRQMLVRAEEALKNCSLEFREFGSQTLCVDTEELLQLKKLMKEFRQSVMEWLNRSDRSADPTHVVQLNLQMFPHTKVSKK